MQVLLVCKPSGNNAFMATLYLICCVIGFFVFGYQAISNPHIWVKCLLCAVVGTFCFFVSRSQFLGEEHLCVEGDDFVIHYVKMFPFKRDKRIPLSEIAEVRYNHKSAAQRVGEALAEFRGRPRNEDCIYLATKSGKIYIFGKDLSERQVEAFICRLEEYRVEREVKGEN